MDIDPLARIDTPKQELRNPEDWLSADDWKVVTTTCSTDPNSGPDCKLLRMAKRLRKIGCKKLKETCFADCTAVALSTLGKYDAVQSLEHTRKLKSYFSSLASLPQLVGPDVYPTHPAALQDTHRPLWDCINEHGPCVQSPLDPALLVVMKDTQPSRNSNKHCMAAVQRATNGQQACPPPAVPPRPLMNIAQQFQQQTLQDGTLLSISGSAHPRRVDPPMFQI